jgi:hypothetical protein
MPLLFRTAAVGEGPADYTVPMQGLRRIRALELSEEVGATQSLDEWAGVQHLPPSLSSSCVPWT